MTERSAYLASPAAIDDLRMLNARFIENFITNDVASHDAILHPQFMGIQSRGARIDRESYLRGRATGFDPEVVVYWDTRDELITIIGDVALVRATNKHVFRKGGSEETGMTTYTDTYLFQDDRWLCIQAQITPVASGCEPGDHTIVSVYIKGVRTVGP